MESSARGASTLRAAVPFLASPCLPVLELDPLASVTCFEGKPVCIPAGTEVWLTGRRVHPSHRLIHYRGLFACTVCGAMGSSKLRQLLLPCPGLFIASGRRAIARLRLGILPWGLTHWPDQVSGPGSTVGLDYVPMYDLRSWRSCDRSVLAV